MSLFTVILDFAGGTYISQIEATSTTSACLKWALELDFSNIKGIGAKSKLSILKQLQDNEPTPLDGLLNAWCISILLRGNLALINIILTENTNLQKRAG